MYLSNSNCWYSNNCLHFFKKSVLFYWEVIEWIQSYAQIIFPAGFAGQGVSMRILLFGWMKLEHPLIINYKIICVQQTQKFDELCPYKTVVFFKFFELLYILALTGYCNFHL